MAISGVTESEPRTLEAPRLDAERQERRRERDTFALRYGEACRWLDHMGRPTPRMLLRGTPQTFRGRLMEQVTAE